MKKKIVVLTGAGISAESGLATFRGADGLWNGHRIEDVATFDAFRKDPEMVLDFYNQRRKQAAEVLPNAAHKALARLEEAYEVLVVTQNVDDLHEQGGSSYVLHLHGKLREARSLVDDNLVYDIGAAPIKIGDTCEKGSQLRPNIVWFGEAVPNIQKANSLARSADVFIVIGTSMKVYPAANLIHYVDNQAPKYLIDPNADELGHYKDLTILKEKASVGVPKLVDELLGQA